MFKTAIGTILLTTLAAAGPRNAAPEFRATDSNGATVRLADYKGKVLLLNFWATWCGGCKLEIPWLIDFEKRYRDKGLAVIGVSMDDDGWKLVKPFIVEKGMNYPVILGTPDLAKSYAVDSMPRTLLIDRISRIAASHTGVVDRAAFESEIQALLKVAIQ